MARGLNKATLIGNLGQDPDIRHTQNGLAVANLTVATSESWTDRNSGKKVDKTEWHRIVLWDKLAEVAGQYLHKGDKVYIEGKLQTRKWTDQAGTDRYTTEIVGQQLLMLGRQGPSVGPYREPGSDDEPAPQEPQTGKSSDFEDEIPF